MKALVRIPILFIAFLTVIPSKSQNYIPLAVEGAHWIVAYNHIDTPWMVDDLWEYYAEGDSNINGESYKKIYYRQLVITQDPPPFEPDGEYELRGFIRDDYDEKKVYAIEMNPSGGDFCPSNEEFVMFDFSVQSGDTVDFCLLPDFYTWTVDTIYSGTYVGFETRYYDFTFGGEGIYEGMGSTSGLFEPMFTPFKQINPDYIFYTYLYFYCRESPCDLLISLPENEMAESYLQMYPVPSKGVVNVKLYSLTSDGEIMIFDVYGQKLKTVQLNGGTSEYSFDLSDYPAGTYFATFSVGGKVLDRKKLILTK